MCLKQQNLTTKGIDIIEKLKSAGDEIKLKWDNLESICTDGAPAMVGPHSGCVSLLEKFVNRKIIEISLHYSCGSLCL